MTCLTLRVVTFIPLLCTGIRCNFTQEVPMTSFKDNDYFDTVDVQTLTPSSKIEIIIYFKRCSHYANRIKNTCLFLASCKSRCGNASNSFEDGVNRCSFDNMPWLCQYDLCACDKWCVLAGDCCFDFRRQCPEQFVQYGHIDDLTTTCHRSGYTVISTCMNRRSGVSGEGQTTSEQSFVTHVGSGLTFTNHDIARCVFGNNLTATDFVRWVSTISSKTAIKLSRLNIFFWSGKTHHLSNMAFTNDPPSNLTARRCFPSVMIDCSQITDIGLKCQFKEFVFLNNINDMCANIINHIIRQPEIVAGSHFLSTLNPTKSTIDPWTPTTQPVPMYTDICRTKPIKAYNNEDSGRGGTASRTRHQFFIQYYNHTNIDSGDRGVKILHFYLDPTWMWLHCNEKPGSERCKLYPTCFPGYLFVSGICQKPANLLFQFVANSDVLDRDLVNKTITGIKLALSKTFSHEFLLPLSVRDYEMRLNQQDTQQIIFAINFTGLTYTGTTLPVTEKIVKYITNAAFPQTDHNDDENGDNITLSYISRLFICLQTLDINRNLVCDVLSAESDFSSITSFKVKGEVIPSFYLDIDSITPEEIKPVENSSGGKFACYISVMNSCVAIVWCWLLRVGAEKLTVMTWSY